MCWLYYLICCVDRLILTVSSIVHQLWWVLLSSRCLCQIHTNAVVLFSNRHNQARHVVCEPLCLNYRFEFYTIVKLLNSTCGNHRGTDHLMAYVLNMVVKIWQFLKYFNIPNLCIMFLFFHYSYQENQVSRPTIIT